MSLLDTILNAGNGGAVQQIAQKFGLSEDQTQAAISNLLPALKGGLQNSAVDEGGLQNLLSSLGGGEKEKYVENPEALNDPSAVHEGNGVLGQLLGSKDASRAVAEQASANTGIDSSILKQMLPMVATLLMGSLSKHASSGESQGGFMGTLSSFLDSNKDGSISDDVMGMASRFFKK